MSEVSFSPSLLLQMPRLISHVADVFGSLLGKLVHHDWCLRGWASLS